MTRGGQAVGLLCRSGVDHPKWRLAVSARFLVEGSISRATGYSVRWLLSKSIPFPYMVVPIQKHRRPKYKKEKDYISNLISG